MPDQKTRQPSIESIINEKSQPSRKPLSTDRRSLRKDNTTTPVLATPPEYPQVVSGSRDFMENRPNAPESSYHSEDLQSPQVAYNPLPLPQNYIPRREVGRSYNEMPSPTASKDYESYAPPPRYAWHKIRLLCRLLSIIIVLLPVFLVYGWYNGKCRYDSWYYSWDNYHACWRITSVTVVPVVVVLNMLELVMTGLNGRGTHPSAQFALDVIMAIGLIAAAVYDFKNHDLSWLVAIPALEIAASVIHFVCVACDGLAIRRLSWGYGSRRGRFPW